MSAIKGSAFPDRAPTISSVESVAAKRAYRNGVPLLGFYVVDVRLTVAAAMPAQAALHVQSVVLATDHLPTKEAP